MVTYGCLTKLLNFNIRKFESLARSTRLTPGPRPGLAGSGYATATSNAFLKFGLLHTHKFELTMRPRLLQSGSFIMNPLNMNIRLL